MSVTLSRRRALYDTVYGAEARAAPLYFQLGAGGPWERFLEGLSRYVVA